MLPRHTKLIAFDGHKELSGKDGFIMSLSGYASTIDVDRTNEIVEAGAFTTSQSFFEEFPVLHVNHDMRWSGLPIGKVTDHLIDERGLMIEAMIADTPKGQEVKKLIELGILRGFSIGFNIKDIKWGANGAPSRITDLELIEISIVSSPANVEAVIEQAQSKGITLTALPPQGRGRGASNMPKPIELEELQGKVNDVEVTIADVQTKVKKLSDLETKFKATSSQYADDLSTQNKIITDFSGEFKKQIEDLNSEIAKVKKSRTGGFGGNARSFNSAELKSIVQMTPGEIRSRFAEPDSERLCKFQRLHDDVLIVDKIMECAGQNGQGSWHLKHRVERVKSLRLWQDFEEFHKALATDSAGAGLEWIPTLMSGELLKDVELQLVVASQFRQVRMPSDPFKIDVFSGPTEAALAAQKSTVPSAHETTEQTFTTGVLTLDAKKARGRYWITTEMTEDSAIAILPLAREEIVRSIARAEENATINGDTGGTHFDTGLTVAATDFRKAWKGLRYYALQVSLVANAGVDMGTASEDNWNLIQAKLGKYGVLPQDVFNVVSLNVYLKHLRKPSEFPSLQTLDKYGPNAVVLTGEVLKAWGSPVLVSAYAPDNASDTGVIQGLTTDRGTSLTINKNMWIRGVRRDVEVLVERSILWDGYDVVAYKRMDFQPVITPTTSIITAAIGYNWQ